MAMHSCGNHRPGVSENLANFSPGFGKLVPGALSYSVVLHTIKKCLISSLRNHDQSTMSLDRKSYQANIISFSPIIHIQGRETDVHTFLEKLIVIVR